MKKKDEITYDKTKIKKINLLRIFSRMDEPLKNRSEMLLTLLTNSLVSAESGSSSHRYGSGT